MSTTTTTAAADDMTWQRLAAGRYVATVDGAAVAAVYRDGRTWRTFMVTADGAMHVADVRTMDDARTVAAAMLPALAMDDDAANAADVATATAAAADNADDDGRRVRNGAASNYRCRPCVAAVGRAAALPAVGRFRVDGKRVPLCPRHADEHGAVTAVAAVAAKTNDAHDGAAAWTAASRTARHAWTTAADIAAMHAVTADMLATFGRIAAAAWPRDMNAADDMRDRMLSGFVTFVRESCMHAFPRPAAATLAADDMRNRDGGHVTATAVARMAAAAVRGHRGQTDGMDDLAIANLAESDRDHVTDGMDAMDVDALRVAAGGFRPSALAAMRADGYRRYADALAAFDALASGYQRPTARRSVVLRPAAAVYVRYADMRPSDADVPADLGDLVGNLMSTDSASMGRAIRRAVAVANVR